tara:strand:+ start:317 stop:664 length:348 start_codon:yes stop_codon:yes gene_type:complete
MIRLKDVLKDWKEDAKIDEILIDSSAMRICCLHSKYLDMLGEAKRQLRVIKRKKKSVPISERRGNEQYMDLEEIESETEDILDTLEKIIYAVNQMSYNLSTITKWRMFLKGVDPI